MQAVERSAELVQNYVAELAQAAVKLTGLPTPTMPDDGSRPQRAFESLRASGVIGAALCKRLIRAHKRRSLIQHAHPGLAAGADAVSR